MDPPRQSPPFANLLRRRSSVYDPARDIFSEIVEPEPKDVPHSIVSNGASAITSSPEGLRESLQIKPVQPAEDTLKPQPLKSPPGSERGQSHSTFVPPPMGGLSASHKTEELTSITPTDNNASKPMEKQNIGGTAEKMSMSDPKTPAPGDNDHGLVEKGASDERASKSGTPDVTSKSERKPVTQVHHSTSSPKSSKSQTAEEKKVTQVGDLKRAKRKSEEGEIPEPKRARGLPSAYSRRPDLNDRRPSQRQRTRSRSRSPRRRRSPKSPYRRRDRSPSPIRDSPPPQSRPRIRPGGATGKGRNLFAEGESIDTERERERLAQNAQDLAARGVQAVSNNFYNQRPEWVKEKGRDWRKNESKIKGLRSFNNWIKSCMIQKFSPEEPITQEELGWGEEPKEPEARKPLLVLDIGCGKGGDLGKWQLAPQDVGLYVGLDPADQSIRQAEERYQEIRRRRKPIFDGRFVVKNCFGEWIGEVPIVREVGIDGSVSAQGGGGGRWGPGGGFDVVTMMFSMHYAFESEERVRMMLRNVAGSLKKGGRFLGVVPNSDALAARVVEWHKRKAADGNPAANGDAPQNGHSTDSLDDTAPNWGNSIYRVRFPPSSSTLHPTDPSGAFRPPFGWKYMYWMDEAVDVPEYVVPWEAFRAIAEQFSLEQRFRKPFLDIWQQEKDDPELAKLSVRMGVRRWEGGELEISGEEREAVGFYHGFCFVKV